MAEEKKKWLERRRWREKIKIVQLLGKHVFFSFFEQVILQCKSMLAGQAACY